MTTCFGSVPALEAFARVPVEYAGEHAATARRMPVTARILMGRMLRIAITSALRIRSVRGAGDGPLVRGCLGQPVEDHAEQDDGHPGDDADAELVARQRRDRGVAE